MPSDIPYVIFGGTGGRGEILERNGLLSALGFAVPNEHLPALVTQMGHCFDPVSHFLNSYNSVSVEQGKKMERLHWEDAMLYRDV